MDQRMTNEAVNEFISTVADVVTKAVTGVNVTCPKCEHDFHITMNTTVPMTQRIATKITPSELSGMFAARAYSDHIAAFTKTLKSIARDAGFGVEVFVKHVQHYEDGSIETVFQVTRCELKKPRA
jgi:bacterioferritin-associated ferredoxin